MSKDYAKYINKSKRPRAERGWRRRLLQVIVLSFLLGIISYGYVVYKHREINVTQQPATLSLITQLKLFVMKVFTKQESTKALSKKQAVESDDENGAVQFSFYTNLAAMQVPVPSSQDSQEAVKPSIPIIPVKKQIETNVEKKLDNSVIIRSSSQTNAVEDKYLLQIAAFKNPSAAGDMRISLLLSGFEVDIVKAIHDNQQIYQLQQGPFSSVTQAKFMQQELKKKGIDSVIIKKIA